MLKGPTTLLDIRDVTRSTQDGTQLLHPVSFSISAHDLIVCQGGSGAGKTVLLRSITKMDAATGNVLWNGFPIANDRIPEFRSQVIYLPQRPMLPDGSVRDALSEPFSWQVHQGKQYDEEEAEAYFRKLSKPPAFLDARTSNLSEGETQIVAIVRAMQLSPDVLLLDEPTSALDPGLMLDFEQLVLEWLNQALRAIVWVTHLQEQANRLATRRFHVEAGRVSIDV